MTRMMEFAWLDEADLPRGCCSWRSLAMKEKIFFFSILKTDCAPGYGYNLLIRFSTEPIERTELDKFFVADGEFYLSKAITQRLIAAYMAFQNCDSSLTKFYWRHLNEAFLHLHLVWDSRHQMSSVLTSDNKFVNELDEDVKERLLESIAPYLVIA